MVGGLGLNLSPNDQSDVQVSSKLLDPLKMTSSCRMHLMYLSEGLDP